MDGSFILDLYIHGFLSILYTPFPYIKQSKFAFNVFKLTLFRNDSLMDNFQVPLTTWRVTSTCWAVHEMDILMAGEGPKNYKEKRML
jgi:hypothetical protein